MNNLNLSGRLTRNPELKVTPKGTQVLNYSIAVRKAYGEGADFFNCVAFGKNAEFIAKNAEKGDMLFVTGANIANNEYTNKQGVKVRSTNVVGGFVELSKKQTSADGKASGYGEPKPANVAPSYAEEEDALMGYISSDDLPF